MPSETTHTAPRPSLAHLPVTLFASVMGVGGLSLSWRRAAVVWHLPTAISTVVAILAAAMFVLILIVYITKWIRFPQAALAELHHPIRMAFVPTITISILILATAFQDWPGPARVLWWIGAVGQLVVMLAIVGTWFRRQDIGPQQVTPAWFIPVVGNVITPLAAPALGSLNLAWFSFGVGMVFWIGLLPLILERLLVTETPLPTQLLPTITITAAPPAVALLSWQALTGELNSAAPRVFYAAAIGFMVLALAQFPRLIRLQFALPWWAYTFPTAAVAAAAIAMAGARHELAYTVVAIITLTMATASVLGVLILTIRALAHGKIGLPEK